MIIETYGERYFETRCPDCGERVLVSLKRLTPKWKQLICSDCMRIVCNIKYDDGVVSTQEIAT